MWQLDRRIHSRPVFKGVYARNTEIRIQTIQWDNTGSLYTSTPAHEGNTTNQPDVHRTNPLMSISWTNIAFIGLTIPFEYKKKDLRCADFIALFASFIDVQDIAW
jgi:hypothetical protein